jgi:flagellar hook protein FlgE
MGYPADSNGLISASSPVDLQLSSSQIPPRATSDVLSGNVTAKLNLDSREGVPSVAPFNFSNPSSYNYSTALSVYDTLGVAHTLTMYFVRASAGGPWNVHGTMDGATPQAFPSPLTFNTSGVLTTAMPLVLPSWALTTGASSPWSPGNIDFAGSSQYGSASSVNALTQGGFATGSLTGLSVGADGIVQGRYSNGESRNLGQVVLATFANPNGLQSLGNNQWALSSVSGPELISAPGTGSRGVLQSSSIEESNVDLTGQLVNMITQQRNYQANAQSIKTQDQIMQTLVNLR